MERGQLNTLGLSVEMFQDGQHWVRFAETLGRSIRTAASAKPMSSLGKIGSINMLIQLGYVLGMS